MLRRVIGDTAPPKGGSTEVREYVGKEALLRQAQELVTALPDVPWNNETLADCLYVDYAEFETLMMENAGGRKRERKVNFMGQGSSAGRAVD